MNVNIDIFEAFDITIDLCKESYEPQTKGKDFLEGEFPVIFRKVGSTLYVAIRGTKNDFSTLKSSMESIKNMIVDCSVGDILGENTKLKDFDEFKIDLPDDKAQLTGHAGFMKELAKYYFEIKEKIRGFYGTVVNCVFTGHSAGGALATLLYYVYVNDSNIKDRIPVYYTITYGAPRVIRDTINNIDMYNKTCPDLIRCFNANDIVSYIPFRYASSYLGTMGSGFVHLGQPIPMDTNVENNSLNALILQVLRGNKAIYSEIFTKYTFDELRENEIIGLLTSDNYLGLMADCMFQCYQKVGVKENVNDEMIKAQTSKILFESQKILEYSLKCDLAEPLGIDEILKQNDIFTSDTQRDVGVSGIYGSIMKYNKLGVEAHDLDQYRKNASKLEQREFDTGQSFLDRETGQSFLDKQTDEEVEYPLPKVPKPVTKSKLFIDLVDEIMNNKEIIGAVEVSDEVQLPALIKIL